MAMSSPVAASDVYFNMSAPQGIANFYSGIQKIRTSGKILLSWMIHEKRLVVCSHEVCRLKYPVAPDVLKKIFRHGQAVFFCF
jgi:hypothetical protein